MFSERKPQLLVVDDEPNLRRVLAAQLTRDGYEVHCAEDGVEGLRLLSEHHIDLLITDLRMPGMDGVALLRHALRLEPQLPVIMITAHGTIDSAVEALKIGAFDYVTKPFDQAEVRAIVRKACEMRRLAGLEARSPALADPRIGLESLGPSHAASLLREHLTHASASSRPVLLFGETGSGKELLAQALQRSSERAGQPFIRLNCAAVDPETLAVELFGAERNTAGVPWSKPGRWELAHGGTLLLTEVDRMDTELTERVLTALRTGRIERIGGVQVRSGDVRLIATTQLDPSYLEGAMTQRAALITRLNEQLNVISIRVPPLRERRADLPVLCQYLLEKFVQNLGKQVTGFTPAALELLVEHDWPGNLRELSDTLERAVLFCATDLIDVVDLPPELNSIAEIADQGLRAQVKEATTKLERELIQRALAQTHGNVTHTARMLKISRKGLQLKMKELGLREKE